jgi:general secretion pathway protein M
MKARIMAFLEQLSERDRLMLTVGGVVCFFYLFYAACYNPLTNAVEKRAQQIVEEKATLAWMTQVKPLAHAQKNIETLSSAQLLTALSTQLQSASFHHFTYQLQQAGTHEIQLSFDEVPYEAYMTWLLSMNERYAFSIKQLNIERTAKAGVVKILLLIEVTH